MYEYSDDRTEYIEVKTINEAIESWKYSFSARIPNVIPNDIILNLYNLFDQIKSNQSLNDPSNNSISFQELCAYEQLISLKNAANCEDVIQTIFIILGKQRYDMIYEKDWLTFWNIVTINFGFDFLNTFIKQYSKRANQVVIDSDLCQLFDN